MKDTFDNKSSVQFDIIVIQRPVTLFDTNNYFNWWTRYCLFNNSDDIIRFYHFKIKYSMTNN